MKFNTKNKTGMKTSRKILAGAVALLPCCLTVANAEEATPNSVDFRVGGAFTGGDKANYQKRLGQDGDFYGGISDLHVEGVRNNVAIALDGHAMFGNEDYEFVLEAVKEGLGYVELGYSEFRTYYDGSAGYYPGAATPPGNFIELYDDALSLDRGEVWFEAGLRMEDIPEITFKYQHQWREGQKDSTMWGRANSSGGGNARAYVPSFYDIDESRDIYSLDFKHSIDKIDLGLSLRYDDVNNDNVRKERRQYLTAAPKAISNRDQYEADLFSSHVFAKSWLNEKSLVSFGYTFTTLDSDFDGSDRVYAGPTLTANDHGYTDMLGGSQLKLHAANVSAWLNPIEDLVFVPSIRAEWEDTSARLDFTEMSGLTPHDAVTSGAIDQRSLSEQLEMRYSGIDNILLYVRGEWTQEEADRFISEQLDLAPADAKSGESDRKIDKYSVGANWYPFSKVSFSSEYYYKTIEESYDHNIVVLDPMMDDRSVDTHDINFRITWRALPNLTFITRYDYQQTKYEQDPYKVGLATVDSSEMDRHIISESVTWNVNPRLYLQGSVFLTSAKTNTAYSYTTGGAEYAPDSENDYLSATLNAGYALSDKDTLQAGLMYYGADNYVNNTAASMPYGTMTDEYMATLAYVRQISPNMVWDLRYGYYVSKDDADGGYNDFSAHMISSGLQVRF